MRDTKELNNSILFAKKQVEVRGKYAHYKEPHLHYEVLHVGLLEANEEPCVVYKALYGDEITWIRPLRNFIEEVEVNGKKIKRFQKTG